ncbi:hypothetical protein [Streptomyces indiaensis]|uniref:Uncharacterized protein n=1 Tax=Streptomyces indiaensis TaxID=284033 RepID=A0ABP5Q214_9ACTN|nr:hypothetical protein [Streptomyces indiaensis]MCF1645478.1 hypothetical protein [Streptomyces indiaensis]
MNQTETETPVPDEVDPEAEYEQLSQELLHNTLNRRHRAAVQALVEERTILSRPAVQRVLIVDSRKGRAANFPQLSGLLYGLGLDEGQRTFLALVMSMVGLGVTTLASMEDLDDRRLPIMLRAILRMAGNEDLAVGRRL